MRADLLLTALLTIYPRPQYPTCIARERATITRAADEAEQRYGVPAGLLLVVAFHETHLGCARGEGGNWGAPIDRAHRHTAGTPFHAATALAASYRVCGTWEGAIARFRSGLCRPWQRVHRGSVRVRVAVVREVYARAGVSAPF